MKEGLNEDSDWRVEGMGSGFSQMLQALCSPFLGEQFYFSASILIPLKLAGWSLCDHYRAIEQRQHIEGGNGPDLCIQLLFLFWSLIILYMHWTISSLPPCSVYVLTFFSANTSLLREPLSSYSICALGLVMAKSSCFLTAVFISQGHKWLQSTGACTPQLSRA